MVGNVRGGNKLARLARAVGVLGSCERLIWNVSTCMGKGLHIARLRKATVASVKELERWHPVVRCYWQILRRSSAIDMANFMEPCRLKCPWSRKSPSSQFSASGAPRK